MILFYCTAMKDLAKKIAENEKIFLGEIEWNLFPDGMPNTFIKDVDLDVDGKDVAFLASLSDKKDLLAQLSVIYALPRYGAKSLKIILPYFPVGTMERVEREGEVATAMTLARMFNAIECEKVPLYIFDIHDKHERFYFRHPVIPKFKSAIPLLIDQLASFNNPPRVVCFPDEGAYKRFGTMFDDQYDKILCHKERFGNKRKVKIIEGSPRGKHAIIVDDLVMTGGTLLECAKVLDQKGAKSVSAYVTHAVFSEGSWMRMEDFPLAHFWITDSCPDTINSIGFGKHTKTKFEILSLAPSIAKILLN